MKLHQKPIILLMCSHLKEEDCNTEKKSYISVHDRLSHFFVYFLK